MNTDAELLCRYVTQRSEAAFTELVQRHVNLVYFAALRQVGGDQHRARDVAQTVFTDLARKAATLLDHTMLTAWLHTSTRFAAAKVRRDDSYRQRHEQEITTMTALLHDPDPAADWENLRPLIDETIHELDERDREAVLLRYFENRPFAEIGAALRVSEDAARMRVDRALDKLRAMLARRGVTSTGAALATAFANQAGARAPAGLASAIASAALTGGIAGGAVAVGAGIFMSTTKVILGAVALAALGTTFYQWNQTQRARAELVTLAAERDASRTQADAERQRAARATQEITALRGEIDALKARALTAAPSVTANAIAAETARRKAVVEGMQANLRQIAAARDQIHIETGRLPTSIAELVGAGKPIGRLVAVGGESYSEMSLAENQSLSVTTPDGITATYDLGQHDSARTRIMAASQARALGKKIAEPRTKALAAYGAANGGQRPANDEALLPYFSTVEDGADFVEFLAAQKTANGK